MLNGRLYRAALLPVLLALVIVAFSLEGTPEPLRSRLVPEAFEGKQAYEELRQLSLQYPDRRPGGAGDDALAAHIASALRSMSASGGGGLVVRSVTTRAQTSEGERELRTVIAARAGTGNEPPIVVLAHRDALEPRAEAQLSGTAALLELARVLARTATQRTIYLVSTSGGTAGDAGAVDFLSETAGPFDAAIVLGDLAGTGGPPRLYPFSGALGSAPLLLEKTIAAAIDQQTGAAPSTPEAIGRLAHLAYPLTLGEQGTLQARGLPAVLVQVGGEGEPRASEAVSEARLAGLGKALLSVIYALDSGPDVVSFSEGPAQLGIPVQHKVIPKWSLELVLAVLLLAPLLAIVDGLARMRRRREPILRSLLWGLSCTAPFLLAALFALVLGALGALGPTPAGPLASTAAVAGNAWESVTAVGLVLVLAWLAWPPAVRALGLGARPPCEAAGVPVLAVFELLSVLIWLENPYTSLLVVPALQLWLAALSIRRSSGAFPAPILAVGLALSGLVPLALELAYYAGSFGLGPLALAHAVVMLVAAGAVGAGGMLAWSLALGCLMATVLVLLLAPAETEDEQRDGPWFADRSLAPIRGPLTSVGPGALGASESGTRR